ncbi:MAG: inositol monophosphatase family protein [Pseudobdellovibrionaceae bacterium]
MCHNSDVENRDWEAVLYKAIKAARLGREVLLHYFGRLEKIEEKFQAGLVSEADKESEKAIFDYLRKNFPEDEFVGEESTLDPTKIPPSQAKGRWIVDPLDGTTNYIHRFPVFCVSIGYEYQGRIQVGVIDVPLLGEVYTAIRGHGAFVNGQRLQVSSTKTIHDSLLATGFFGENEAQLQEQLRVFSDVVRKCRGVRRAGAAAYDLAQVARGVFDGFWEKGLKPWDSAAGLLLVEEAGGQVCTYRGQEYSPYKNSIIATNATLAPLLVRDFTSHLDHGTD